MHTMIYHWENANTIQHKRIQSGERCADEGEGGAEQETGDFSIREGGVEHEKELLVTSVPRGQDCGAPDGRS